MTESDRQPDPHLRSPSVCLPQRRFFYVLKQLVTSVVLPRAVTGTTLISSPDVIQPSGVASGCSYVDVDQVVAETCLDLLPPDRCMHVADCNKRTITAVTLSFVIIK